MSKLIAFAGLPGSGKTTLARLLARQLGAVLLNKDEVRAALFAPQDIEYSSEQNDFCMEMLYRLAVYHARKHPQKVIIIDGRTYSRRQQIEALKACAVACHCPLLIIECICSEETARERLLVDADKHLAKDRDVAMYQRVRISWEEISEPKLVLVTDQARVRELVAKMVEYAGHDD